MKRILVFTLFLYLAISYSIAKEKADIIVALDGSGNFTKIQDAINSIPANNNRNVVILIKNGIYREQIFITKSYITLVGEDRDSTRIVFPVLRKKVNQTPMNMYRDWKTAVINIDTTVTDLTIANLTVHNNYGGLYGDHDHQFAIRGGGTRIIILNCNIIADGADTVSLWNKKNGMYYHADCYFEGYVDFVCPRGWCFITDSKFFSHSLSAAIWHDGDADKSQKFVIRYSSFDGVPNFPLGRNHRDGQIFLLDCIFSRTMADTPIYLPPSSKTPWKWGARHYYHNCHREGGDYDWFKDNLETAEGSTKEYEITAKWTFDGKWDPEGTMPAVLPFVFLPRPRAGSYKIKSDNVILEWVPARNVVSHSVYFGKDGKLMFAGNQKENKFNLGKLEAKTRYYWRIDEVTESGVIVGPLWHFTTE